MATFATTIFFLLMSVVFVALFYNNDDKVNK
jgi:hypothetical protein